MTKNGGAVNRYRQSVTERLLIVESQSKANGAVLNKLGENFEKFVQEIAEWRATIGRPNWPVIIGLLSSAIAALGVFVVLLIASLSVFWFMINAQVVNVASPIIQKLEGVVTLQKTNTDIINANLLPTSATLVANMAETKQDRVDLKDKFLTLQGQVFTNVSNIRAGSEKLKEMETQLHAVGEIRNVQWSQQQRTNNLLQDALHSLHAEIPSASGSPYFYPKGTTTPPDQP